MVSLPGSGQTPDPNSSSVRNSLLKYKDLLKEVLKQLQLPNLDSAFDPAKVLRSDIELHGEDLKRLADKVKMLINKPGLELFLSSTYGLWKNVFDASGVLGSCLIPIDIIHSSTADIRDRMKSAALLKEALEECRDLLKDALSQFKI